MKSSKTQHAAVTVLTAMCVCALLLSTYFHALYGPWLFDDFTSVLPIKAGLGSLSELWQVVLANDSGLFGRSLPLLSFAANFYFGGEAPFNFKLTNLLLHTLNFFLVYFICRYLFLHISESGKKLSSTEVRCLALFCSLIWVLHPMHMSTVMYVVQRMAMMSATFSLGAMLVYLMYRTTVNTMPSKVLWMTTIVFLIFVSCVCKENGALTVLYIALLEVLLFPAAILRFGSYLGRRKVLLLFVGFACSSFFLAIFVVRDASLMTGYELRDFGLVERLLTQPVVILFYLKNTFLPNVDQLSLYHDGYVAITSINQQFILSVLVISGLLALALFARKAMPLVSFGIGFFFISHLLESTIFPLELVFEHRNYLAILGLLMAVVAAGWMVCRSYLKKTTILLLLVSVPILLLAQKTYIRSIEWSSEETLLSAALRNKPKSVRARMGITKKLASAGKLEDVLIHLESSIESHPRNALFSIQKVMFTGALGREDPLALQQAIERLATLPLRTTDLMGLNDLYKFRSADRFRWPSMEGIADMFAAAAANQNSKIRPASREGLDRVYLLILSELET